MAIAKVSEITATSTKSFEDAIERGVKRAGKTLKNLASAWVAFARTGNPNNPQIPQWPAYDALTKPTMIFDADTRVVEDPKKDLRGFWSEEPRASSPP